MFLKVTGVLLCLCFTLPSHAQILKELERMANKEVGKKGTALVVALDSIDFQYAISINQGAGFFDVEQKGETKSKLLYSFKASEDKNRVDKARDSLEIGIGMYGIRRYEMAEMTIRMNKFFMEKNGLENEMVYLRTLSSLGLICLTQGKNAEAASLLEQALLESEKRLGKNSAAYIANLNNHAKLLQVEGKYTEAEKQFGEAAERAQAMFGGGMQPALILNNKAMLYQTLGQYDKAKSEMDAALLATETAPKKAFQGKKSMDNRKFKANLAMLYQVAGNLEEAEKQFLELQKIYKKRKQTKNAEYAGLMNQIGVLYIQMDKMEMARAPLVEALNVYKKRWGENNIYFARTANDLGNFHRLNQEHSEAKKWLEKAMSIRIALLHETHPEFIKNEEDLALLYWNMQEPELASDYYERVMSKTLDFVERFFPAMSETEKTQFWDITAPRFQRFYNFALEQQDRYPSLKDELFNYHLTTKGLLLSATSKVRHAILNSNDNQLIEDYLAWQDKKEQLARLYSYSKGKLKAQDIDLPALENEANAMEKLLSERSSDFASAYNLEKWDFRNIQSTLTEEEVVVDMIRVNLFKNELTEEVVYLAVVLDKNTEHPILIEIKEGQELESKFAKFYRNAIQYQMEDGITYEKFWQPIDQVVGSKKRLYFSPDGIYNQININTLYKPKGQFVIENQEIIVLGNSKDVLKVKQHNQRKIEPDAFLLGYPTYGTTKIAALPGTQIEVDGVSQILKSGGYQVKQFMAKDATESNVKSMVAPHIVHIATHGYFLQDSPKGSGSVFAAHAENAGNNPLLKSGLILAGTGKTLSDTTSMDLDSNDNGILTAYEAMNLDLRDTRLVVLSACETGLGEIKSGEGVYGLQRVFQVAGAEAIIMSLWKVDDAATQQLMTYFYQNWIEMGNKQKAFRAAQLKLKTNFKEPYYWGAFVMIGG